MPLAKGHRQNFDTLRRAMLAGDAALMECQLVATGEPVAVICAANRLERATRSHSCPSPCCFPATRTRP